MHRVVQLVRIYQRVRGELRDCRRSGDWHSEPRPGSALIFEPEPTLAIAGVIIFTVRGAPRRCSGPRNRERSAPECDADGGQDATVQRWRVQGFFDQFTAGAAESELVAQRSITYKRHSAA